MEITTNADGFDDDDDASDEGKFGVSYVATAYRSLIDSVRYSNGETYIITSNIHK